MDIRSTRHTTHFWGSGGQQRAVSQGGCKGYWIFQSMAEEHYHNEVTVSLVTTRSKIRQFSKLSVFQDNQKHIFT